MSVSNQRRHEREHISLPAILRFPWGELDGFVENIGEGGAFFVTDTHEGAVDVGDPLSLELSGDSFEPAGISGAILRVDRYLLDGELLRAFAIRFDRPHPLVHSDEPDA